MDTLSNAFFIGIDIGLIILAVATLLLDAGHS